MPFEYRSRSIITTTISLVYKLLSCFLLKNTQEWKNKFVMFLLLQHAFYSLKECKFMLNVVDIGLRMKEHLMNCHVLVYILSVYRCMR
jgi:hypothetical protein